MSGVMSVAAAGVQQSIARFDASAVRAVKAAQPGSNDDLPAAIVDTNADGIAAKADMAVFNTANKMMGSLLDMLA